MTSRRLRLHNVFVGLGVGLSRVGSCEKDVEDVPGAGRPTRQARNNVRHVVFRVAWYLSVVFDEMWFFDHRSTHRNISDLRRVFPSDRTDCVSLRSSTVSNKSKPLTCTVASSFVCTSPPAVITAVGFLDTHTVSSSAEFRSFLLDALEPTTNFLFSCLIVDGVGRHQTSEGEKNVALCFLLSL